MALRRPLRPRSRFDRLVLPANRLFDPPNSSRPAVGRRASTSSPSSSLQEAFGHGRVSSDYTRSIAPRGLLEKLLRAIQVKDVARIYHYFRAWTDVLDDPASPYHEATLTQLQKLPPSVFSEIVRSVDPLHAPSVDFAHGLYVSKAFYARHDLLLLVDEYGVRRRHGYIFTAMKRLMAARLPSRHSVLAADMEVMLRCTGAAGNLRAAKHAWHALYDMPHMRTAKTWNEFLKARFLTEKLYYQFDRSRVAVQPRNLHSNRNPLPREDFRRADHLRLSMNALQRQPWNRVRYQEDEDIRRVLRRREGFKSFKTHFVRGMVHGNEVDEESLCTSMIAFARSGSVNDIMVSILQLGYDINLQLDPLTGENVLVGGRDIPRGSPMEPTTRLLDAVVEAFGTMNQLSFGTKLLDFISRRYNIAIPHSTWSNLLSWTYVCASAPKPVTNQIPAPDGSHDSHKTGPGHVLRVFKKMTSKPYNFEPSFSDLDHFIKALIESRAISAAIRHIRKRVMPLYQNAVTKHETALLDEIMLNEMGAAARASFRRLQTQTRKVHMRHTIGLWFHKILQCASENSSQRESDFVLRIVPRLLEEFGEFFDPKMEYRTAHGIVTLERPEAVKRFDMRPSKRKTLPQKRAAEYVQQEGSDKPDFPWPLVHELTVLERVPVPRKRMGYPGRMPGPDEVGEWAAKIERELLL